MKNSGLRGNKRWNLASLPFITDYNDHFETPLQAYVDVKPMLDWLDASHGSTESKREMDEHRNKSLRGKLTLYDPYYCDGRSAIFLKQIGYENIIHEKRDFYADIAINAIPKHDVLITNPPYSDTHKKNCLDFCFRNLRGTSARPFLILLPAYTACKQYFRDILHGADNLMNDVVYLVPSTPYRYDHPEGTGKGESPFQSLWFCGLGQTRIQDFQRYWLSLPNSESRPKLATSLEQLQEYEVISFKNRPNPKKRRRRHGRFSNENNTVKVDASYNIPLVGSTEHSHPAHIVEEMKGPSMGTKSKYRDAESGKRCRKRF